MQKMKKLMSLFAALIAAFLLTVSCTKELDNPDTPQPPVVEEPTLADILLGTWNVDCDASTIHEEMVSTIDPYVMDYTLIESGLLSGQYAFCEDGTAVLATDYLDEGSFSDTLSYRLQGDTIIFGADELYRITQMGDSLLYFDMEDAEDAEGDTYRYSVHLVLNKI